MTDGSEVLSYVAWLTATDRRALLAVLDGARHLAGDDGSLTDARLELAVASVRERLCPAPGRVVRASIEDPDVVEVRFTGDELDALDRLALPADLCRQLRGRC